jgi:hypothetical protein
VFYYSFIHNYIFKKYKHDFKNFFQIDYINYKVFINLKFNLFFKPLYFKVKRDEIIQKNKNIFDLTVNTSFNDGYKLKFINYLNKTQRIFYYSFFFKNLYLNNKFNTYIMFYNFSKSNDYFYDFNFILNNICLLNESVFVLRAIRLNKKKKNKPKNKFEFDISYIKNHKRGSFVLKSLHLYSNTYNYYKYYERFLGSVYSSFFDQKNSVLYKRKINAYTFLLKKKKFL